MKNTFTEAEIKASSVDGRMYGLVRKYQYGGYEVAVMNRDIVEELGIDPASVTDMESLGEALYQVPIPISMRWYLSPPMKYHGLSRG